MKSCTPSISDAKASLYFISGDGRTTPITLKSTSEVRPNSAFPNCPSLIHAQGFPRSLRRTLLLRPNLLRPDAFHRQQTQNCSWMDLPAACLTAKRQFYVKGHNYPFPHNSSPTILNPRRQEPGPVTDGINLPQILRIMQKRMCLPLTCKAATVHLASKLNHGNY